MGNDDDGGTVADTHTSATASIGASPAATSGAEHPTWLRWAGARGSRIAHALSTRWRRAKTNWRKPTWLLCALRWPIRPDGS